MELEPSDQPDKVERPDLSSGRALRLRVQRPRPPLRRRVILTSKSYIVSHHVDEGILPAEVQDEQGERDIDVQPRQSGRLLRVAAR